MRPGVGVTGRLHNGHAGVRLMCGDCDDMAGTCDAMPSCYEIDIEAMSGTAAQREQEANAKLAADGHGYARVRVQSTSPVQVTITTASTATAPSVGPVRARKRRRGKD